MKSVLSVTLIWFVELELNTILVEDIIVPIFFIILYLCQYVRSLLLSVSHLHMQSFHMSPTNGTHQSHDSPPQRFQHGPVPPVIRTLSLPSTHNINPLNAELNPICYLLALLGAHHFLHVSRIRVKLLTFRLLMSYIYIYGVPILDVSRSHTTTQHSR